ncbi:hypothetical protein ABK040_002042 [Willaertia magna]
MSSSSSSNYFMAVSQGLLNKLQDVAQNALITDNELAEKIIISFVGAKPSYKTGILFAHGKKKIPKEPEIPLYFAHSNYTVKLSSDHVVTFDPRDLKDDDDKETIGIRKDAYFYSIGFVLCFNPYDREQLRLLEKKYVPEIISVKKKNAKKEIPFILFGFDWNPNGPVKRNEEDRIPKEEIINVAKRIANMTAYIEMLNVNLESIDETMDLMLRVLYQAGGQFLKKSVDDAIIQRMETYEAVSKKKCILM